MLRMRSFLVLAVAMAVSACASGGGGGGVTPPPQPPVVPVPPKPPAPPAQPYASNCATTPNALTCTPGVYGQGIINTQGLEIQHGPDRNGGTNTFPFDYMQIDRRGTPQASDDRYVFSYFGASVNYRIYQSLESKNDGLGPVRTGSNIVLDQFSGLPRPGDGSVLTLYDITNVLQGGLDYIQLGQISPTFTGRAMDFFVVGQPLAVSMPTSGSARFDGGTRGAYISASGTTISTSSDITLNANFATGAVTGSTSNFYAVDANGAAVFTPHDLGFNFTATIAGSTFGGTASSTTMSGAVKGGFYGEAGRAPVEAGLTYSLTETVGGGTMIGVGGLKKN